MPQLNIICDWEKDYYNKLFFFTIALQSFRA